MGTKQVHKEVFVKHCQDQIKLLDKFSDEYPELDIRLVTIALEQLIEREYER